jgi:hypothetical protein
MGINSKEVVPMNASGKKFPETIADQLEERKELLGSKEVIRIVGTDKNSLARWVREGRIPAIRIGKNNKFDPVRLAAWLRERQIGW